MTILLTDSKSILEFLYRKSIGEEVSLTMNLAKATAIVGTSFNKNFYDKTLILTSNKHSDLGDIIKLAKVNKIVSRLPLGEIGCDYELEPYKEVKFKDFKISGVRNKPISDLSIKDFLVTKYKDTYLMEGASSYLGIKYKGNLTLVGLLKHQLD